MKNQKPWDARKFNKQEKEILNNLWTKSTNEDKKAIHLLIKSAASEATEDYRTYKKGTSSMNY